jgi:glycosyltransferase involved in cell wall biosynthesis
MSVLASRPRAAREGRVRVVAVTPELPYFPGGSGGSTRQYQLLTALRERGADVAVVAPVHPDQRAGAQTLAGQFESYLVPRPASRLKEVLAALRERPGLALGPLREPLLAWQIDVFWTRLRHRLAEAVAAGRPDVILVEHDWAASWHPQLPAGVPRALTLQNLSWRYYGARARVADGPRKAALAVEGRRWLRHDRRHLPQYDLLVAMSEEDARVARTVIGVPAVSVPNGVDTRVLLHAPPPPRVAPAVLLYTGTMTYPPNAEGLHWLLDEIWPRIRAAVPEAHLVVVGKDPPADARAVAADGVTLAGWVPDVAPYFAQASAILVPIRSGAGTRLKVLDGLASGRPVVSTRAGAEGIPLRNGEQALLADDPAEFAAAAARVLRDRPLAERLGMAGRRLAEEEYDWHALGGRLEAALRRLIAR